MKNSKYIQLDQDVLLEYVYDDKNLQNNDYIVTDNLQERTKNFSFQNDEGLNNRISNQFVIIDPVTSKAGINDPEKYNFLKQRKFTQTLPVRHDRVKIHFPINFNFEGYAGCFIKLLHRDFSNENTISLSNYYFDKQDQDRFNQELELSSPPITINSRIWGKFIELTFPSPSEISKQRTNNLATPNSINSNISNGEGLSTNSPIFIEFGFIDKKQVINITINYLFSSPYQTSVPLSPNFENLAVDVRPSSQGDWFDISGIFNETINGFNNFILNSRDLGKRYNVEYDVTIFEENIKRNTQTFRVNEGFNEPVEFRPVIKFSSTTAIIEVIMRLTDQVDESTITKRASYGLLPDEISKYSRSLVRLNVNGIKKPVIYNSRNSSAPTQEGNFEYKPQKTIETIRVPYPLLTERNNVVLKTESSLINGKEFKGFGKLKLVIDPFDNIIKFSIAKSVEDKVEYFNLLEMGEINLIFKNPNEEIKSSIYRQSEDNDLEKGTIVFKLDRSKIERIRRIFQSGVNIFYITSTIESTNERTVLYQGTFIPTDSVDYVNDLARDFTNENDDVEIRRDSGQETAIITRRSADPETDTDNFEIQDTIDNVLDAITNEETTEDNPSNVDTNLPLDEENIQGFSETEGGITPLFSNQNNQSDNFEPIGRKGQIGEIVEFQDTYYKWNNQENKWEEIPPPPTDPFNEYGNEDGQTKTLTKTKSINGSPVVVEETWIWSEKFYRWDLLNEKNLRGG
jgi:hypothetical protein